MLTLTLPTRSPSRQPFIHPDVMKRGEALAQNYAQSLREARERQAWGNITRNYERVRREAHKADEAYSRALRSGDVFEQGEAHLQAEDAWRAVREARRGAYQWLVMTGVWRWLDDEFYLWTVYTRADFLCA